GATAQYLVVIPVQTSVKFQEAQLVGICIKRRRGPPVLIEAVHEYRGHDVTERAFKTQVVVKAIDLQSRILLKVREVCQVGDLVISRRPQLLPQSTVKVCGVVVDLRRSS